MIYRFDKDGNLIKKNNNEKPRGGAYDPALDPYRDYRAGEILPELRPILEEARKHRGIIHILTHDIDNLIKLQSEDPKKAAAWLKWKFIGSASWSDVYGSAAKETREQAQHRVKLDKMAEDLKDQGAQLAEIKAILQALAAAQFAEKSNDIYIKDLNKIA